MKSFMCVSDEVVSHLAPGVRVRQARARAVASNGHKRWRQRRWRRWRLREDA